MHRLSLVAGASLAVIVLAVPASSGPPVLRLETFLHTSLPLGDVLWTGKHFLYVDENTGRLSASDADGKNLHPYVSLPPMVEEFRCRVSTGRHGWPRRTVYCHSPDNLIYQIDPDRTVSLFAQLPEPERSDGALAFDTVGRFGYELLAATGSSGTGPGGEVFAMRPNGRVRRIGSYPGPGGAENIRVGSRFFGRASGDVLISIDWVGNTGRVLAMGPRGKTFVVADNLGEGVNPIVMIGRGGRRLARSPAPGFYVTDTASTNVFFASAKQLMPYGGGILVGTEISGRFWAIVARGSHFVTTELSTNLPVRRYNLEGATWVGGRSR